MDFDELFKILQNSDETERLEAKTASHGIGKSFLASVSAFANEPGLGGGYILLGISEQLDKITEKFTITGVYNPDKLQQQVASQCRELFNIPVRPSIKVIPHHQGKIILIFIEEASKHDKPIYIKKRGLEKGAYRRIGSSDQICTREDIDLLYRLRTKEKYDETVVVETSISDFDPKAISLFRYEREKVKPDAIELKYNDENLLKSIRALKIQDGKTYPTIAGLLLFGQESVLKQIFQMRNHVDYILIEGREWITDPERRYVAIETYEPLIISIPRLISQIMKDIPQLFALDEDQIRRIDNPLIPRKVIREALVNSLMHRDYCVSSPTQIIKYANRFEFRNAGHSLKPEVELSLPGSCQRNGIIAQAFHDINYAEAKGTGIGTMRDEMKKVNLSIPLIESNRSNNQFNLTLLSHHLFNKEDVKWLTNFKKYNLSDEEARTLIIIREKGSITNSEYRAYHGVDTLEASSHLRRLRDYKLLEQRGGGNATYYVPSKLLLSGHLASTHFMGDDRLDGDISDGTRDISDGTRDISDGTRDITSSLPGFPPMSKSLIKMLKNLGKRTSTDQTILVIKELCSLQPLKPTELGKILKKDPSHLRRRFLSQLIKSEELEYLYPDNPNHPLQAYKIPPKNSSS